MTPSMRQTAVWTAAATLAATSAMGATMRFDNGGGDNLWETPANWQEATNDDTLPGSGDVADISNGHTVNLSTAQSISELHVAHPNSSPSTVPGVATLNILPGANLQISSSNGVRIGRVVQAGQLVGSSQGRVIQTGGLLQINSGTNGLRLSQADAGNTLADSYYEISGGSLRGGATNGSMTAPMSIGFPSNTYGTAEFHVRGSGATEIRFEDLRMGGSLTAGGGDAVLRFSLDAGGVTPIIAEDELQFRGDATSIGNNFLEIDLIGEAPEADIVLIQADRIATNGGHTIENFTGLPHGSEIVRQFGIYEYTWNLLYTDGANDGVLADAVVLDFVSKTVIPEPASAAMILSGALLCFRRRGE